MLSELQRALETIYDLEPARPVEDFLVGRSELARLGVVPAAPEELFIIEHDDGADVGLYLSPECLASLARLRPDPPSGLLDGLLPAFSTATEGVSHYLYYSVCAPKGRQVSRLELEVQAEVDKFATALLHLWRVGERIRVGDLLHRLFERVSFRASLDSDQRDRYQTANRLSRGYCRFIAKAFCAKGRLDSMLSELRHSYRLPAQTKFARFSDAAV
jgi:hypothetical protein